MSIIDQTQSQYPPLPVCEKHNYRGLHCPMCLGEYQVAATDIANKLETLLYAIKITNSKFYFPLTVEDAEKSLKKFKELK